MTALWTSEEAQGATLGIPGRAFDVNGLSIDTRTLKQGDLFVALKGENRDGHDFVKAAFDAGAGAALVSHERPGLGPDAALLAVANTQRGLEDLAAAARARSTAKIAAVTGSAARPQPRNCCATRSARSAPPTARPPPTTITGACRSAWRRCRETRNTVCSKSA
ncbi:MAG: Mur ligase domain-containing protein [Rhizomicrobium sp.]